MRKVLAVGYGALGYLAFLVVFFYAIGFVGNVLVPKSIDSGAAGPFWPSILIDVGLLGLFGLQHSVMARPAFKRRWTKIVPAVIERSTYVLLACLLLGLLFWQWRPLPGIVWNLDSIAARWALWAIFGLGWLTVFFAADMISSSHLLGWQQVLDYFKGRNITGPEFKTPGFYRFVRHPIMLGFLIAFWVTPQMSVGHLVFAAVSTAYILIALQFEEHDLVKHFGNRYENYRSKVPMLTPGFKFSRADPQESVVDGNLSTDQK